MSVTMNDVAREAGVSLATVGRVLHKNGYASKEVREKVEEAASRLGYVPNTMARALKSKKSGIIGSLVVDNPNDLYQKINSYVIAAAERRDYKVVTIQGRIEQRDEEQIINQFISMQVDGLVIISNSHVTPEQIERLHRKGIPLIFIERGYSDALSDNILVLDRDGTRKAAERFIESGHERIALICCEGSSSVERDRLAGYRDAMDKKDLGGTELIKVVRSYSSISGKLAMRELLRLKQPPTAVLCTSDTLAAGAMQALYEAGKRVPEDVSIIGYDNVLAAQLAPPIDSMDLELTGIGETVFTMLDRRSKNPELPSQTEYIDTVYVERGTVKNIDRNNMIIREDN